MAYGESNVTYPMTSRDAKWSRLYHIFVINSRNKGYNHSSLYYDASRLTIVCNNSHVSEILKKMRLRIRNESCMYLGY